MNLLSIHARLLEENKALIMQSKLLKIEDKLDKNKSEALEKELMKEIIKLNAGISDQCARLGKLK
jgi:hypothetical protein